MSPIELSISYTSLSTYLACPQKYKFQYVDHLGTIYARHRAYYSFGRSMHLALTKFYADKNGAPRKLEDLYALLRENWVSEGYDSQEQEASYKSQAMAALANFFNCKDFAGEPVYLEEFFRISLQGFSLIGRIDRIDLLPDGSYEVIHYKASKSVPGLEKENTDFQMTIYALACKKKFGFIPARLSVFFLTDNEKITVTRSETKLKDAEKQIEAYVSLIQKESEYLPKPDDICKTCDFLTICPAMGLGVKPARPETLQADLISNIKYLESIRTDLYALNQATQELSSVLELPVLERKVIEVFNRLGKMDRGALFLIGEKGGMECAASHGLDEKQILPEPYAAGSPAIRVPEIAETLLIEDYETDDRIAFLKPFLSGLKSKSVGKGCVLLPLRVRENLLGFIFVSEKTDRNPFTNYDRVLYSNLASQSAISIQNAKLYELAITDGLTKLYIHRYFQMRLESELSRAKRYNTKISLLMLDLDYFKKINDTYGHQQGDLVLKTFAQILKTRIRPADVPARYGGEEFAIILPETNLEGARLVGEKLRAGYESFPFALPDGEKHFTASVGVAFWDGISPRETFVEQADQALYKAKELGRNRVCYYG